MYQTNPLTYPAVTVLISTRNRGDSIVASIRSIMENDYPRFNLIIVDQSENNLTKKVVEPFLSDCRIQYIRTHTRGLGVSHNLGISISDTEIIAITDDDCVVSTNWISEIVKALNSDEQIGLVFGRVDAYNYDRKRGYVPVFDLDKTILLQNINADLHLGLGIGASMALRKKVWELVKGFDETLGPGSPFGSLEDRDFAIRVLLANYFVYYTTDVRVVHYGFRRSKELRKLAFEDWLGFGASYAKYLKCGHPSISRYMLVNMWLEQAVVRALKTSINDNRISKITPVFSFWLGFVIGIFSKVDYSSGRFVSEQPFPNLVHSLAIQAINKFT